MKHKLIGRFASGCLLAMGMLISAGAAHAQTVTVGSASNAGCDTSELIIPITISGATNVSTYGFTMSYNPANLNFLGYQKGAGIQDWGVAGGTDVPQGTITVNAARLAGTVVNGDAELAVLRFSCNGCPTAAISTLSIATPTGSGFASATFVPGQITCGQFPTYVVGNATGACPSGGSIAVPITVENLVSNFGGFEFDVSFPNDQLDFEGFAKGADTTAWGVMNAIQGDAGVGLITVAGTRLAAPAIAPPGPAEIIVLQFSCETCPNTSVVEITAIRGSTSSFQDVAGSVTCVDNQPPVANCVSSLTVNLSAGVVLPADLNNGSSDPDDDPLTFQVNGGTSYALSCADVANSPITLVLTVSDGQVTDTCDVAVTVVDNVPPSVTTQNISVNLGANGTASITAAQIDNGSSDTCSAVTLGVSPSTFNCGNLGANTVTLTVTDQAGNSATGTATVTVSDVTNPVVTADNNVTLTLSGNSVAVNAAALNASATDNCAVQSLVLSPTSFNCTTLGARTVTITATDTAGNTASVTRNVNVVDATNPVVSTNNVVVSLDANGVATVTAAQINNNSTDNCGTPTVSLSKTTFTCADIGQNVVTLTATDGSGNTATGTATVTVLDEIGPSLDVVTEPITLALSAAGTATLTAEAVYVYGGDNCEVDADSLTLSQSEFGCADLGSNTVTVSISDTSGNTTQQTVTVNVVDNIAPTAVAQNITVQLGADGTASIVAADINNGSSDNCNFTLAIDIGTFDCANTAAPVTVTLTATDTSGNIGTATAQVTVVDSLDPVITGVSTFDVALDANGTGSVSVGDLVSSATDNCAVASVVISSGQTSFTCADLGTTGDVVVTATDTSGNAQTLTVTVTVSDPTGACVVEEGEGEECENLDADGNGIVDDPENCLTPEVVVGFTNVGVAGGCLLETRQVLFTNTDGTGNVTLSVPDPNNFEVTVNVTIPRNVIPVGESAVFAVKVSCDLANLLSGDASASALGDNLTRDDVPVSEIIPGTYVLATVFQSTAGQLAEVDGVNATITYQGLDVNTVEQPTAYQHGTTVVAGTEGPLTNGDAAGAWNEADTALEGSNVVVSTNGLSVFVVTQPAPQIPFLSVKPNSTYARIVGITAVGSSRNLDFTLQNIGPGTIAGSASVTGTGFSITGDASYTLAGATTDTVTVRFAPATAGTFQGSITFTGGTNGPVTIQLWGVGVVGAKTAFFGCGAADGAGMGFGDIAVVGLLLMGLLAASRLWVRTRES